MKFKNRRNQVIYGTHKTRNYYKSYFEMIKNVAANIWKDIKQLITLKSTNKGTQTLFQIINDETFTQKFFRSAKRI